MQNIQGWIPQGSTIQTNEDATLSITPPTGWIYVGTIKNSTETFTVAGGQATVSCDCKTSGTCLPFTASGPLGSTSGCAGGCSDCNMKQSATISGEIFSSGGYLNFNVQPRIILEVENYPASFKEMNNVPEVAAKIQQFLDQVYAGATVPEVPIENNYLIAPAGYLMAMVDICGRATTLVIPETAMIAGGAGSATASCACTNGTCTVKTKTIPFVGSASWCEGVCSGTCSLTTSIAIGGVATYAAQSYNY